MLPTLTLVLGIGSVVAGLHYRRTAQAMRSWPSVVGRITRSEVELYTDRSSVTGPADFYRARVEYEYTVAAHDYRAHDVGAMGYEASSQGPAKRVVARYPVGSDVRVFYDPTHPGTATLASATAVTAARALIAGGAIAASVGLLWWILT